MHTVCKLSSQFQFLTPLCHDLLLVSVSVCRTRLQFIRLLSSFPKVSKQPQATSRNCKTLPKAPVVIWGDHQILSRVGFTGLQSIPFFAGTLMFRAGRRCCETTVAQPWNEMNRNLCSIDVAITFPILWMHGTCSVLQPWSQTIATIPQCIFRR
jgi:hypothetical protein